MTSPCDRCHAAPAWCVVAAMKARFANDGTPVVEEGLLSWLCRACEAEGWMRGPWSRADKGVVADAQMAMEVASAAAEVGETTREALLRRLVGGATVGRA